MKNHESLEPQQGGFIAPKGLGSGPNKPLMQMFNAIVCGPREGMAPKNFSLCLCASVAMLLFSGCVSAHKKGRTIHERWNYSIVQAPGCYPVALITGHEIWEDEWTGGGRAFLADPKASELVSLHTNQIALGGSSSLSIGAFQSEVSTNGIRAAGDASSQIIQGVGSAAGQLINKSVTGTPLK